MDNRLMTVRDVAKLANVEPEVVRYYTRIGLIVPQRNPDNGYKLYGHKDVNHLIFIRKAKQLGFTLKEIRKILDHATDGTSPCPLVRSIIEKRIEENRQRINDMTRLQASMEKAVQQWQKLPDGIPDGDTVCILIESFTDQEVKQL